MMAPAASLVRNSWLLALAATVALAGKRVSVKEVVFDSPVKDIQWLGDDQKTVMTLTSQGGLYRSTNGGETWSAITDYFKEKDTSEPFKAQSLTKSPADENTILVSGAKFTNYVSSDKGATWKRVKQRSNIHTVIFHKTRPTWMLLSTWTSGCKKPSEEPASTCQHILYLSKDLGKTMTQVQTYVVQFAWGSQDSKQQDRIYLTHFTKKTGDQPKLYAWSQDVDFAYVDSTASSPRTRTLVPRGNKFLISHGFIFVAKVKSVEAQSVSLMVSKDGGSAWNVAQLPVELDEKSYTVLDTSEGAVLIHVNHGNKEDMVGNVYLSDANGYRFSLSLTNNVRGSGGDCEFDKVLNLEGVYMANFKDLGTPEKEEKKDSDDDDDDEEDASKGDAVDRRHAPKAKGKEESVIRTVISFDKGAAWNYLKAPKVDSVGQPIDCPQDKCWLHLHGVTNFRNYAPFYSTENAVGIIMGTGNVGPYLRFEQDQTNTFMSRDGGLTWVEAHKGAFIYEYGDHGGLIVMADDVRKTKQVVFSWNEGQSWYDFELTNSPIDVDNVVTEPNATSTQFLLYGTRGDTGVMYHLNFGALEQPLCKGVWAADSVSSDYETWTPSDGKSSEKCLMGRQVVYTRRKQTSECFNGEKFERPVTKKSCLCTEESFECTPGFSREVGSMQCKFANEPTYVFPSSCQRASTFSADAYRKVVGDSCEGGWTPTQVSVNCPAKPLSKGAMSVFGSIGMLAILMFGVNQLSQSDKVRSMFGNYGFDGFGGIKYAGIGFKAPESALDSVGTRFDADFIEEDQDDFGDAPQLMSYTNGAGDDRDDLRRSAAGKEAASAAVPRLTAPPGAATVGASADDSVDLL